MFFVFLGLALADLLFLGAWLWHGFQVEGDPLVGRRHQVGGLLVCILTCFTHAVTFVYFLGTGLAVKEARRNWGIDLHFVRQTRRYKLKAYPPAMVAIAAIILTGVMGGALQAGDASASLHRWLAVTAIALSTLAFLVALRYILRNGYMMGLLRGEIEGIRGRATAGEVVSLPETGKPPDLLRHPSELRKPPGGFLAARALVFLGLSSWLLYAYLEWWLDVEWASWVPFTILSALLLAAGFYLRNRHPLPADVEF